MVFGGGLSADSEVFSDSFYHGGYIFSEHHLNIIIGVVCSSFRWNFSDGHCIELDFGLLLPSALSCGEVFGTELVK